MRAYPGFAADTARLVINPRRQRGGYPAGFRATLSHQAAARARDTIAAWQGYAPTPLVSLPLLAASLGVAEIVCKDESARFGLGSFKALGGAYAVFRLLAAAVARAAGTEPGAEDLLSGRYHAITREIIIACATDGNHGRAAAWGAARFGAGCVVFVHSGVSERRAQAIAGYGAEIVRTPGNYDDSVRIADETARARGWTIVSDTSYPGYTDIPRDVMQGYSVMVEEALGQLGGAAPTPAFITHVFIQGGVGGLAAAVVAHLWERFGAEAPHVTVVEPDRAACLQESARAGRPVAVGGDLATLMAGLACGEPSALAWPILDRGAGAFLSIPDEAAIAAMRLLASGEAGPRMVVGESGVAGLAGLIVLAGRPAWRAAIGLGAGSRVLVVGTEGDTDPALYQELVGQPAAAVRSGAEAEQRSGRDGEA